MSRSRAFVLSTLLVAIISVTCISLPGNALASSSYSFSATIPSYVTEALASAYVAISEQTYEGETFMVAAVAQSEQSVPPTEGGEKIINRLSNLTTRILGGLSDSFSSISFPSISFPSIVIPKGVPKERTNVVVTSTPNAPRIQVTPSVGGPVYTTAVRGVSEDFMNQSFASLRANILASVASMLQSSGSQNVTNVTNLKIIENTSPRNDPSNGVSDGGTGSTTLSGILVGNGTSPVNSLLIGSNLTFDGATLSATGGSGITSFGPAGQLQTGSTQTLSTTTSSFNGLTVGTVITADAGTNIINWQPTLSGTLTVGGGGTGLASVSDGRLTYGNGTSALVSLATSTGSFLTNSYTTGRPVWTATSSLNVALADTTGTLAVLRGGTGVTSFTANSLLYSNSAGTALAFAATSTLNIGGTASNVTGTVLVVRGGTATTTFYNGGVLFYNSTLGTLSQGTTAADYFYDVANKRLGLGTSSPYAQLSINPTTANGTAPSFVIGSSTATKFIVTNAGNVGIGTTSPWRTFSVTGTAAFTALSTISATSSSYSNVCIDNAGGELIRATIFVGCIGSSERIKHDIQPLAVDAVSIIKSLQPVSYIYNEDPTNTVTWGFVAEKANQVDSHLAASKNGVVYNIVDRSFLAVMLGAEKRLLESIDISNAPTTTPSISIAGNGYVGIGESSPSYALDVQGVVGASGFVVSGVSSPTAALTADGTGVDLYKLATFNVTSIQALATKVDALLARIDSLEARMAHLENSPTTAMMVSATSTSLLGVFNKIFASEVHTDNLCVGAVCVTEEQFLGMVQASGVTNETLSVQYEELISPMILAIEELGLDFESIASTTFSTNSGQVVHSTPESRLFVTNFFSNLFARTTIWFADAENGIGDFFANRVRTQELCLSDTSGETCITRAKLDELLAGAAASTHVSAPDADDEDIAPVIDESPALDPSLVTPATDETSTTPDDVVTPSIETETAASPVADEESSESEVSTETDQASQTADTTVP